LTGDYVLSVGRSGIEPLTCLSSIAACAPCKVPLSGGKQ
jgi:hypothetical protein